MLNKPVIAILIILIIILISSILLIFPKNNDVSNTSVTSTELFDVDTYLQSQLKNHIYKINNTGTVYDRYLIASDYDEWNQNLTLNDPIIKYQFVDEAIIDLTISGPENPNTVVIYPTFTSAA